MKTSTSIQNALFFGCYSLLAVSCAPNSSGEPDDQPLSTTEISEDFSWSASNRGSLVIAVTASNELDPTGMSITLTDSEGRAVAHSLIENGEAHFDVVLPASIQLTATVNETGSSTSIDAMGNHSIEITSKDRPVSGVYKTSPPCSTCGFLAANASAESPVIPAATYRIVDASTVPDWQTTAPDDKIEIWSSGFNGVPSIEGNQFIEINANNYGDQGVYQEICAAPGSTIYWSLYHRGRDGVDSAIVKIGATTSTATVVDTLVNGNTAWGFHKGIYTVPAGQPVTVILFEALYTASGNTSIGNFIDALVVDCDADADGVPNSSDDYPTDPLRAYRIPFPTVGEQILGFEDLWPFKGDYDFNDLQAKHSGYFVKNADLEYVEGFFDISLDAIGAGLDNGIGILLRDAAGDSITTDVLSSVDEGSADAANRNGIIPTSDIFADLTTFYKNNGMGPSATPDTVGYAMSFLPGITGTLEPELYLFRTDDRTLEIHRPNILPTMAFDNARRGTFDDAGNFRSTDQLPWAIEIVSSTMYLPAREMIDITEAYPLFKSWAQSGGTTDVLWYTTPDQTKVFSFE